MWSHRALALALAASACGGAPAAPLAPGAVVDQGAGLLRTATGVAFRTPSEALAPPPPGALHGPYAFCADVLARHGIDLDAENAPALARARRLAAGHPYPYDAIVVPGYTPLGLKEAAPGVHPIAQERLEKALADYRAGKAALLVVTGGNVHPPTTPYNEAVEMKRFVVDEGLPPEAVAIEPCARHSHTNLRNAGRFLLSAGLRRALVVSSYDQSMYFGRPRTSSFDARCLADLGYLVGVLEAVDDYRTTFVPSGRVFERGRDPLDP